MTPRSSPVEVLTDLLGEGEVRSVPERPRPGDRPGDRSSRRRPLPPPPPVAVVRAIAGAAVSVCAVALGLVVLLQLDAASERVSAVSRSASAAPSAAPSPVPSPPATPAPAPVRPAPAPAPAVAPAPPRVVPVTVLNNSRRSKLAARGAARFAAAGWPVAAVGNFRGRIPVTTVYYDPGLEASARAFAARFEGIVRVRPRFATLPARGVVVVLTREFPV